ncbi:MAG: nucleoside triphosphate pyrophosphohydrolase [Thermodesulfobacteriota bacterium]|nr:nucleoside triphosphate pyrophosphohydrolase [Thermodesulfobacteriota bacterium]
MEKSGDYFIELMGIIARLRAPDGCPWDRKQTPDSLKTYFVEETYELLDAIEKNDPDHICEELGDLLFMIMFLTHIFQEKNHFTMADVIRAITEKMLRRHPHVFSDSTANTEEEVRKKWYEIKLEENAQKGESEGLFASVPKALPALRRAQRISERAARAGFEWPNLNKVFEKLDKEISELKQAVSNKDRDKMTEEIGNLLFAVANISRLTRTDSENALRASTDKFVNRFTNMEQILKTSEKIIPDLNKKALNDLWDQAKKV